MFESILMTPKPLALVTYLLGRSCVLSSMTCHFKGPGGEPGRLHSDNGGIPSPFSMVSQVANVNYALTPYSREAGALAMVPGSHRLCRQPSASESHLAGERTHPDAVAMDPAPGDCVVRHGNTWHGSFRREVPGIRMNLATYFARQFVVTQEEFGRAVPPAPARPAPTVQLPRRRPGLEQIRRRATRAVGLETGVETPKEESHG